MINHRELLVRSRRAMRLPASYARARASTPVAMSYGQPLPMPCVSSETYSRADYQRRKAGRNSRFMQRPNSELMINLKTAKL